VGANDLCQLADVRDYLNMNASAMAVSRIVMQNGGLGYTTATATVQGGTGTGLTVGTPVIQAGVITSIPVTATGAYFVAPTIVITGDGAGAVAVVYIGADYTLARLITAASQLICGLTRRTTFNQQTITEVRNGNGNSRLCLRIWPVISVNSISINNFAIPPSPDGVASGYLTDGYSVMLNPGTYGIGWNGFCRGFQNVRITYTNGYAVIPFDIAQACIELVGQKYRRASHIDQDSQQIGAPGQTTSFSRNDIPKEVLLDICRYKLEVVFDV
jgi:hypothetical protein